MAQLFREGKPFGRLAASFLREPTGILRWFGVFVESAGGRVLFFPGFATIYDNIEAHRGGSLHARKPFVLDHITLDANRQGWHTTSEGSDDHVGTAPTALLADGSVVWCGLSVSSFGVFKLAAQSTLMEFTSPSSDMERRRRIFVAARDGAQFPILQVNNSQPYPFDRWFWHFAIVVGPSGFPDYNGNGSNIAAPIGSPYLLTPLLPTANLPSRVHRIALSDKTDVQVVLCPLPGILSVQVTFTGAA